MKGAIIILLLGLAVVGIWSMLQASEFTYTKRRLTCLEAGLVYVRHDDVHTCEPMTEVGP